MDRLYADWNRYDAPAKQTHSVKDERQESLWANYPLAPLVREAGL